MRRSGIRIMAGLIRLVGPLTPVMILCILLGTLGFFCAIAITVLAAYLLLTAAGLAPWGLTFAAGAGVMAVCAVARAVLRYGEQTCGHYIAFRLLAMLRDRVFGALRRLAPAKLEGRGRGDLIALITGDIELLEVFYAHTIAPVSMAVLVSLNMALAIGSFHPLLGFLASASYAVVGCGIPLLSARMGRADGMAARARLGALNSYVLESIRGMDESLQFDCDEERQRGIGEKTAQLNELQQRLKRHEAAAAAWSGVAVTLLTVIMLGAGRVLELPFATVLLTTVMLSASFGPVLALANLSGTMDQVLASGERVLSLLEEHPETEDVVRGRTPDFTGAAVEHLSFSYGGEEVLHDLTARFPQGEIVAVTGKSGSGKSTLLKLLMRFWSAAPGSVRVSDTDVGEIPTSHLRALEGYMIQDTDLFHDSIAENIRVGKLDATQAQIEEAARKASLHDFIGTLPKGYDTPVGELGETLSGGERQRIGLARAFLHDAPLLLLDEPTSNLDSLNEGVILRALDETRGERTVILVSHRPSTLSIADRAYSVEHGRLS